jgi:uncharacterized protein
MYQVHPLFGCRTRIIPLSSLPKTSNNIIQKGLAFVGEQSGTVTVPGAARPRDPAPPAAWPRRNMRDILASAMLAFVATVRRDGSPSLSPKASTIPYDDDHLLFVDMASPQTIANLRNDPRIEINSVDFIRRRGYRFAGTAQVLESGHPIYDWGRDWLLKHHGPEYPTNHVVLIKLQSAEPLLSPAYTFGGRKEEELRADMGP